MSKAAKQIVNLNYVAGDASDQISILDRGLNYGDGLFETIRISNGHAPLWEYHRERLLDSAAKISIELSTEALEQALMQLLNAIAEEALLDELGRDGIAKIILTRGVGGAGYIPPEKTEPKLVTRFTSLEFNQSVLERKGVALQVCNTRLAQQACLAGLKHLSRLEYVLAAQEMSRIPKTHLPKLGLLLDTSGDVIEAIHQNIFWIKNGELITPDLSLSGVKGVMRRVIIEKLAPAQGLNIIESRSPLSELLDADEIFIANSVRGIWPVLDVDDSSFPLGQNTLKLMAMVDEMLAGGNDAN